MSTRFVTRLSFLHANLDHDSYIDVAISTTLGYSVCSLVSQSYHTAIFCSALCEMISRARLASHHSLRCPVSHAFL